MPKPTLDPIILPSSYYKHRYLCDGTLGKLCKWLRVLGYDCDYDPNNNVFFSLTYIIINRIQ